ncbi:hypothetical protein F2Q69_00007975 [Brassica cretica]|uniref:Uncharacterized protein n=1 Tax=Brassica cretica TaxID=69181 RepID=A0A8S9P3J5_BRACR|nr:hypothetical protein F2Q69_00007975 [Brassica cretica]
MTSLLHWQSFNNKCRLSNNRCCRCSRPYKISNMLKKQLRKLREKSVNKEHNRSNSVNNIDDLAAKVDQLLKGNHSQVFIMEEAAPEKSAGDLAFDDEISRDDQQEQDKPADPAQSNQGQYAGYQKNYQPRTYVLSQPQNNPPQMQKHQNTQPATSAPVAVPQDETKAMGSRKSRNNHQPIPRQLRRRGNQQLEPIRLDQNNQLRLSTRSQSMFLLANIILKSLILFQQRLLVRTERR